MARLIGAESGSGPMKYLINVDQVRHVQQSTTDPNQCVVYFDKGQSLIIGMSAHNFSALVT